MKKPSAHRRCWLRPAGTTTTAGMHDCIAVATAHQAAVFRLPKEMQQSHFSDCKK
ncbi:hypothetical protein AB4Z48_20500 [Cupriavidus sp. 2TAF22]|uniref:hypothetical protein n=1 Tax=unclassified Cupriavidus TaxID=2640874 RepID=UPI003F8FFA56